MNEMLYNSFFELNENGQASGTPPPTHTHTLTPMLTETICDPRMRMSYLYVCFNITFCGEGPLVE